jgi:D-alanyl-D-alanine carboxypeptidase
MKRLAVAITAGTALLITTAAAAPAATLTHRPSDRVRLQHDAEAILVQGAPGVIAEADTPQGRVTVRAGAGNLQTHAPVPWNAKFRIGSLTKTYVATTLLQLVGEGRLSLDDTVDRWLPGLVHGNGNDGRRIAVRQLLQHTSGLPEYAAKLPYLSSEQEFQANRYRALTPEQLVGLALEQNPAFAPGAQWQYSNTNYVLAGLIIQRVTGHSWRHEITHRILRPLGLHDTSLPGGDDDIPEPHAVGYHRFLAPGSTPEKPVYGEPVDATEFSPTWADAAGEMISTTADTNRFLGALLGGELLRPAQLAEMKKTVAAKPFEDSWPGGRYGLGLMSVPTRCGLVWFHGGDLPGFQTRTGVNGAGTRSVTVSLNTATLKPRPGAPKLTRDVTLPLIEDGICG